MVPGEYLQVKYIIVFSSHFLQGRKSRWRWRILSRIAIQLGLSFWKNRSGCSDYSFRGFRVWAGNWLQWESFWFRRTFSKWGRECSGFGIDIFLVLLIPLFIFHNFKLHCCVNIHRWFQLSFRSVWQSLLERLRFFGPFFADDFYSEFIGGKKLPHKPTLSKPAGKGPKPNPSQRNYNKREVGFLCMWK